MFSRLLLLLLFVPSIVVSDSTEKHWHFPELRGVYRETFRLSGALGDTALTTETLELMLSTAALSPVHELGMHRAALENGYETFLSEEREAELREQVLTLIREGAIRWGPQPLWEAVINGEPTSTEELPFYLIEQFLEDAVPYNAMNAAEIYLVGLQEDPDRFVPPLVSSWEKLKQSGRENAQEAILVASLLLMFATDNPQDFPRWRASWFYCAYGGTHGEPVNFQQMENRARRAVLSMAAAWAPWDTRYGVPGELEHAAIGNRRMAWVILEKSEPLAIQELRTIALQKYPNRRDKRRAVYLWMLRDVDSLLHPTNHEVFLTLTHMGLWEWDMLLYGLLAPPGCSEPSEWMIREELGKIFMTDVAEEYRDRFPDIRTRRMQFLNIIRDHVEKETNSYHQLRQAALLLNAMDEQSHALVSRILVSHLADDDYYNNASEAGELLWEMNQTAKDPLYAGLKVGAEIGDWQLLERTAALLSALEDDFDPAEFPEATALMITQLRDDEVENNAAAAVHYLRLCGPSVIPLLEAEAVGEDEQSRSYAERLLRFHRERAEEAAEK